MFVIKLYVDVSKGTLRFKIAGVYRVAYPNYNVTQIGVFCNQVALVSDTLK